MNIVLDNCNLKLVSIDDCMIGSGNGLTINDCTIKGSGNSSRGAIYTNNAYAEDGVALTITGLTDMHITNASNEALHAFCYASNLFPATGESQGCSIIIDVEEGSRIVLIGGNSQGLDEPINVLNSNGEESTLCWAILAEKGDVVLSSDANVNGTTTWQTVSITDIFGQTCESIGNAENAVYNTLVIN